MCEDDSLKARLDCLEARFVRRSEETNLMFYMILFLIMLLTYLVGLINTSNLPATIIYTIIISLITVMIFVIHHRLLKALKKEGLVCKKTKKEGD